jgi:bifunctional non-homologous end joining protein LigD
MLWDHGTWQPEPGWEDVEAALAKGDLKFRLDGVKLKGAWALVRIKGWPGRSGGGAEERSWLLIKHKDSWAGPVDVATAAPRSVKSGGDFAQILAAEKADIWGTDMPAGGGAAGKLLREIIEQAARIKAEKETGR